MAISFSPLMGLLASLFPQEPQGEQQALQMLLSSLLNRRTTAARLPQTPLQAAPTQPTFQPQVQPTFQPVPGGGFETGPTLEQGLSPYTGVGGYLDPGNLRPGAFITEQPVPMTPQPPGLQAPDRSQEIQQLLGKLTRPMGPQRDQRMGGGPYRLPTPIGRPVR